MPTNNVTFTGYYTLNSFNVAYAYNKNVAGQTTLPTTASCAYGSTVYRAANATAPGYNFGGWTTANVDMNGAAITGSSFLMPNNAVTFTGIWTPRTDTHYVVQYYQQNIADNNYTLVDTVAGTGTTDTVIPNAHKDYTGFTERAESVTREGNTKIAGTGATVLKLYYNRNTYDVTYAYSETDVTPPALPTTVTYRYGAPVAVSTEAPALQGYDFGGWSTADVEVTDGAFTMPTNSVTITGNWIPRTDTPYMIQYYQQNLSDNGYTMVDIIAKMGTTASVIPDAHRDYTGFSLTAASATAESSTKISSLGTTALKLYYDRNTYDVTYAYSETDTTPPVLPMTVTYRYGASVAVSTEAPTLQGYDFGGWSTSDTVIADGAFTMPDKAVAITGTWIPRTDTSYIVQYYQQNLEDDNYTLVDTVNGTGTTASVISDIHRDYAGFTETEVSVAAELTKIASNGSTALSLYFNRNIYAVTYVYSETDVTPPDALPAAASYRFGAPVTVNTLSPTLQGYDFGGWSTTDAEITDGAFITPAKNVPVVGNWIPRTDTAYTVEYYQQNLDDEDFTLIDTVAAAGTTAAVIPDIHRDYAGFTETEVSVAAELTKVASNGSTLVKLYFSRNSYTVTYTYSGDASIPADATALPASQTYKYGQTVPMPDTPTTAEGGKQFKGWLVNGETVSGATYLMPADNVIVNGVWYTPASGPAMFAVTFLSKGGSAVAAQTVAYGGTVAEPAAPTLEGYTFDGWYADSALTDAWGFAGDTVTANTTLYAKWAKVQKFTVSFASNGGSAVDSQSVVKGGVVTEPADPTKGGYTFDGWYADSGLTDAWDFSGDTVTANTTLYAKWTQWFTVSFDSNGGNAVSSQSVAYGGLVTSPTTPTLGGYTLVGWYADSGLTDAWDFSKDTVTANTTLYAKWVTLYTVDFESEDTTVATQKVAYGEMIAEPDIPLYAGYSFAGWYADSDLTMPWDFINNPISADTVLYAKWLPLPTVQWFTVSFDSNKGSVVDSQTVADGELVAEPTAPTKEGYTFDGWYADNSLTEPWYFDTDIVTTDTTLYAKWEEDPVIMTDTGTQGDASSEGSTQGGDGSSSFPSFSPLFILAAAAGVSLVLLLALLVIRSRRVKFYCMDGSSPSTLCYGVIRHGVIDITEAHEATGGGSVMVRISWLYALRHLGGQIKIGLKGHTLFTDRLSLNNKYVIGGA